MTEFPCIDMLATGANIKNIRIAGGFTVRDLQKYFGFDQPQAIYKWQWGECLPSIDNLYALSKLFQVPIDKILVGSNEDLIFMTLYQFVNIITFILINPVFSAQCQHCKKVQAVIIITSFSQS
jgi:transcriptional regulator with XRE-family HTH domain